MGVKPVMSIRNMNEWAKLHSSVQAFTIFTFIQCVAKVDTHSGFPLRDNKHGSVWINLLSWNRAIIGKPTCCCTGVFFSLLLNDPTIMLNHTVTKNEFTPPFFFVQDVCLMHGSTTFLYVDRIINFSEIKIKTGYSYTIICWMLNQFWIMKFCSF